MVFSTGIPSLIQIQAFLCCHAGVGFHWQFWFHLTAHSCLRCSFDCSSVEATEINHGSLLPWCKLLVSITCTKKSGLSQKLPGSAISSLSPRAAFCWVTASKQKHTILRGRRLTQTSDTPGEVVRADTVFAFACWVLPRSRQRSHRPLRLRRARHGTMAGRLTTNRNLSAVF